MKLSTRSRYGLRILMQIAIENENGELAQGRDIAEKQEISEAYLEQLMIPLKGAGLVRTVRGCTGGYRLSKSPEKITVLDLIEIFEGGIEIVPCSTPKKECPRIGTCPVTGVWRKLTDAMKSTASAISLKDVLENKFMYQPG